MALKIKSTFDNSKTVTQLTVITASVLVVTTNTVDVQTEIVRPSTAAVFDEL